MKIHISKNYFYNDESRVLYRIISDNRHILWRPEFKGCVCFNKEIYDNYKSKCLKIGWIKRIPGKPSYRYSVSIKDFDDWKETINDREPQYVLRGLESYKCEELK